ncbi:MAG: sensor histidine kinase [Planctomycetes bacterium]|nr:sensor histidine kinase [Planctomycetota bacterium]
MTLRARLALTVVLTAVPLTAAAAWVRAAFARQAVEDAMAEFALAYMDAGGRERCEADPGRFVFDAVRAAPVRRDGPGGPPGDPRRATPGDPRAGEPVEPPPGEPRRPDERPRDGEPVGPAGPGFPRGPGPHGPPMSSPRRGPMGPPAVEGPGRATRIYAYRADLASDNAFAPRVPEGLARAFRAGDERAGAVWSEGPLEGRQVLVRTPWVDGPCAALLVQRVHVEPASATRSFVLAAAALAAGLLVAVLAAAGPLVRRIRRLEADVARSAASRYREPVAGGTGSDEIASLARAFDAAGADVRGHLDRLEARERTLRDFVANTTHDVAIPLTVLQGHLVALRDAAAAGRAGDPRAVHDALEESHYIDCLLRNLSAAARLEATSADLDRRPVDLGALVERVAARHRPVAEGAGVVLEHAVPPTPVVADGDVTLLEQAVSNLVHNAVRYHRAGGHAAVVLETAPRDAAHFVLRVLDDGPGIAPDELPRVLDRSYRGREARTRAPHGAGLGLSIAKDVVDRHGFRLSLAAREGGGLVATIEGPTTAAPREAAPAPASA